jgi:putative membrane protein
MRSMGYLERGVGRSMGRLSVRLLYLAIIVVFAAAIIIFGFQNTQIVSVSLFGVAFSMPLAILVFVAYVLGAVTGGSLFALLRWSFQGTRRLPGARS